MGEALADLVREHGYHIATGFVGTPLIMDALVDTGHADAASRLLLQTENPSWLYPVTMGATTIWERWDSLLEDGSVNPGDMTSFNHYALGAVADWLHRRVAGLAPGAPGYRVLRIAPMALAGLDSAEASLDTPYGRAAAGWRREHGQVVVTVLVPANATAEVRLPGQGEVIQAGSGRHRWVVPDDPVAIEPVSRLSADTTMAEILEDPEAYHALKEAIATYDPGLARHFTRTTRWSSAMPVSEATGLLPGPARQAVVSALAQVNKTRIKP